MHQILLTSNENSALKTFQNFFTVDLEPCRPEVKLEIFKPTFDKSGTGVIQKFIYTVLKRVDDSSSGDLR